MSEDTYYHGFLVDENRRRHAIQAICQAPDGYEITVSAPTRTSAMNARMWVCLSQMAEKCKWHGLKLDRDEWKNLASSGVRTLKVVPNLDGTGFVGLGKSTSRMSNRMIGQIIDTLCSIAGDQGVQIVFLEDIEPQGRP
ncbi:MAG: hypothetical protein C0436_04115 [Alphaproteobacteria bacterium]|nr:hypothetical protein [Alphaproteobacteria bacterium]